MPKNREAVPPDRRLQLSLRRRRRARAFRGGCIGGASARSGGGAHLAGRGRRLRGPRGAAAAQQEPHAGRRWRQGHQERRDRGGHRRSDTWSVVLLHDRFTGMNAWTGLTTLAPPTRNKSSRGIIF